MEKLKVALILVVLVVIAASFAYRGRSDISENTIEFTGLLVSEISAKYPMYGQVIEPDNRSLGIATEERLNFGRVPAGSTVKKTIVLNNYDTPVKVRISSEGNITPYVSVDKNDFVLSGSEEIIVSFKPVEAGSFGGDLNVAIVKPNPMVGWLIGWM
jgi:hypothetical protein